MAITDELRSGVANYPFRDNRDFALFEDIADRIDAELAERYVELPKDADGEPIHIGDVMEDGLDQAFTPKKVKMLMLEDNEWMLNFGGGWSVMKHHEWHHYHAPTVEDVLREMHAKLDEVTALYVGEAIDSDERNHDEARIIAEYAAKLRLAGDAE